MSCDKIQYLSKEDAVRHLHMIQNISKKKKVPVRCYQCDKCKRWHLTSKEILTDKAKNVKLKLSDQWSALLTRQERREDLFTDNPFEKQFQKALSTITHNINIQCEVLNEKFNYRAKIFNRNFNSGSGQLQDALRKVTEKYNIPLIKVYPKSKPSKLDEEMDKLVKGLAKTKQKLSINEAELIIAHYIK